MNLLIFHLEANFTEDRILVANNEVDLENFLSEKGYRDIIFSDLRSKHGTCSFRDEHSFRETAKCFYATKI
jgi:hypothetical protein